jgi:hypothetical protein
VKTDLKQLAMQMLKQAQEDLKRDRHLIPVALVVGDDEVLDFTLTFEGQEEKQFVYSELVRVAREHNAHAIITINDARLSDDNNLGGNGFSDCLYLTISGPSLVTQSTSVAYESRGDQIAFGEQIETTGDRLNLLKGWAQEYEA